MRKTTVDPGGIVDLGVPNYSHGVLTEGAGRMLHLSGQVGLGPDGALAAGFDGQCRQAFANIAACLDEAGMDLDDVAMLRIFMTRREDLAALRQVRAEVFGTRRFASTLVFVSGLVHPDWLVELEVVALA